MAITPGNPMARWAFSSANLYAGRYEDSYREARHGRYLTARSPYRYWWDLQLFIAAMMTGREAEAAEWMEKCAAGNRRFRPPLRYLVVLRANAGDEERAQEAIGGLRKLEPEFSVDMMLGDPDYPASLLHRATLFDLQRVAAAIR